MQSPTHNEQSNSITTNEDAIFNHIRPTSKYLNKNTLQSKNRTSENKRNQIQLQLIGEVNQQYSKITDTDIIADISTSGSDPTFDTMTSVGDEQESNAHRTRAQKVHTSSILAPKFKNQSSMFRFPSMLTNAVCSPYSDVKSQRKLSESQSAQKLFPLPMTNNLFQETSVSSETSAKSSRQEFKKPQIVINNSEEPESEKKSSSPKNDQAKAAAIITERQVKYLGLVIEKDDEQLIEINEEFYMPNDPVKRQYVPIRENYIRIVKNSRRLCIDSFDRRGRKDMKKTIKNLHKIARSYSRMNQEQERIQFY